MDADFLILADGAQVVNNKLYLLGGAWTTITARQFPATHAMSVAVGITVEWTETNQQHYFSLEISSDSGNRVLAEVGGQFETGRPSWLPAGGQQLFLMAVNVDLSLEGPGKCAARLLLNGQEAKRKTFLVLGPTSAG